MTKLQMKAMLFIGLGALALLPGARASERDQKTVLTFSGPVEIPGQVLPAGTYVFKLLDSGSNRHIVQIFSKDEKTCIQHILCNSRLPPPPFGNNHHPV